MRDDAGEGMGVSVALVSNQGICSYVRDVRAMKSDCVEKCGSVTVCFHAVSWHGKNRYIPATSPQPLFKVSALQKRETLLHSFALPIVPPSSFSNPTTFI